MTAEQIAHRLEKPKHKAGGGWMACCPAHADSNPSLSIDDGDKGVLVNCLAGCSQEAVVSALQVIGAWSSSSKPSNVDHGANLEAKEQRQRDEQRKHAECRERSAAIWNSATPAPAEHPYLLQKNVKPYGLKLHKEALVVPVRNSQGLVGLQFIKTDGSKIFLTGTDKKGGCHVIGSRPESILYLAEGYATAATIHEATGQPVAVCFDCGNLTAVALAMRSELPETRIVTCADNDRHTEGNPGLAKATEAAQAVGGLLAVPDFPSGAEGSDFNDLAATVGLDEVKRQIEAARKLPEVKPEPLPLRRPLSPAEAFPIDALPQVLRNMAEKIIEVVQAPEAMVGQSLLIASALAAQSLVDVSIDGRTFPTSLSAVTIGESGERKSATDNIALAPHRKHEKSLIERAGREERDYQAALDVWKREREQLLNAKGDIDPEATRSALVAILEHEPQPPIGGQLLTEEPTYEGLVKLLQSGQPSIGIFSSEGGRFIGGHAMSRENELKTAAGLSKLWDGSPIDRTRSGDGSVLIYGRRVAMHLMLQPGVAGRLLANQTLADQGLLSRCLVCYPKSTIGTRLYKPVNLNTTPEAKRYFATLLQILEHSQPVSKDRNDGLSPREITLTNDAMAEWIRFHDHVELLCKDGESLAPIKGFACKAAEQAARIAGTLAVVENVKAQFITLENIQAGIAIAQFYLGESLRLFHSSADDPELILAENCLNWAIEQGGLFSLPCLYQRGPNRVRDKKTAQRIVEILEQHNWIIPVDGGAEIDGKKRREAWKVSA